MRIKKLSLSKKKLYYLASPYSHEDSMVRECRYLAVDFAAVALIRRGIRLIEPISMCHQKSLKTNLPTGYGYWQRRDRGFVELCDGIIVLKTKGWKDSIGVTDELEYAKKLGKEVIYLNPRDIFHKDVFTIFNHER